MRWMANKKLNYRISIKDLYEMRGTKKIEEVIRKRKLKWVGNLKRSDCPAKVKTE